MCIAVHFSPEIASCKTYSSISVSLQSKISLQCSSFIGTLLFFTVASSIFLAHLPLKMNLLPMVNESLCLLSCLFLPCFPCLLDKNIVSAFLLRFSPTWQGMFHILAVAWCMVMPGDQCACPIGNVWLSFWSSPGHGFFLPPLVFFFPVGSSPSTCASTAVWACIWWEGRVGSFSPCLSAVDIQFFCCLVICLDWRY